MRTILQPTHRTALLSRALLLTISIHRKNLAAAIIEASIWSEVIQGQYKHFTMSNEAALLNYEQDTVRVSRPVPRFTRLRDRKFPTELT